MGIRDRVDLARLGLRLSSRIRPLSPRFAGPALVVCAIGLGILARDLSRADVLTDWEHRHGPAPAVWKHALGARGLVALSGTRDVHQARRTLPETVDRQAWFAHDGARAAVSNGDEVYCRGCGSGARVPDHWEPLGEGWAGFEATLNAVDRLPAPTAPSGAAKRAAHAQDPLEIRY